MLKLFSGLMLLGLLAGCFWFLGFLWFMGQMPTTSPILTAPKVDAIVVLTGGRGRLTHGLKLLEMQKGNELFVSGVNPESSKEDMFHSSDEQMSGVYQKLQKKIILGDRALDTRGNATETAEWIKQKDYYSFLLVTGHYHIPRSLMELRYTLPEAEIIPAPVFSKRFHPKEWWRDKDTVLLLLGEYHKYVASAAFHFIEEATA